VNARLCFFPKAIELIARYNNFVKREPLILNYFKKDDLSRRNTADVTKFISTF